jgi:surface antigen
MFLTKKQRSARGEQENRPSLPVQNAGRDISAASEDVQQTVERYTGEVPQQDFPPPLFHADIAANTTPPVVPFATSHKIAAIVQPQQTKSTTLPVSTASLPAQPQRTPLVIQGSGRARTSGKQASNRRSPWTTITAIGLSFLVVLGAFAMIVPVDREGHSGLSSLLDQSGIDLVPGKKAHTPKIPSEMAARAAAVDGYDPYAHVEEPPPILADGSTSNRFFMGQCTYWANIRYHELTGIWVPWLGDAYQWYFQALAYHWHTSDHPNPDGPSILVLGPYTQNAYSALGHVAIVERDNGDGTVLTSNMHWPVLGEVSYVTFHYPASGTHFIWL